MNVGLSVFCDMWCKCQGIYNLCKMWERIIEQNRNIVYKRAVNAVHVSKLKHKVGRYIDEEWKKNNCALQ